MIAYNKKGEHVNVASLLSFSNINMLSLPEDVPAEVISYLNPTIEYLHFEEKNEKPIIHLKFNLPNGSIGV